MGDPYREHGGWPAAKPTRLLTTDDYDGLMRWLRSAGFDATYVVDMPNGSIRVVVYGADAALLAGLEDEFAPIMPLCTHTGWKAGAR